MFSLFVLKRTYAKLSILFEKAKKKMVVIMLFNLKEASCTLSVSW